MVFSSAIFLFVFLPIFLSIYYLTPYRFRSPVILAGSYIFYAWWRVDFLFLFAIVTFLTYLLSLYIERAEDIRRKKQLLTLGVVANLLTLAYFKYFNFGVAALNDLIVNMGGQPMSAWSVILPIGVSFYIFHCISYLADVYRGDAEVADTYWDFAAFTALFPHLIAGPVLRYKDLAWQFRTRTHSWDKFNEGVLRFGVGFAKKVLIADTVAPLADAMFALPDPTFTESWIGILSYAIQLYFDFSGYSDMAVGLALMMGFRFIENFDNPYISTSITEFWRRWHISLSTWLRDYLYIPLGGNKKGRIRTYINLMTTMTLGGLWHGANWTFILWGAWHGLILSIERMLGGKNKNPYPRLIALPLTFVFVLVGWVLFRSHDLQAAFAIYHGMSGLNGWALTDRALWQINPFELTTLGIAYILVFASPFIIRKIDEKGFPAIAARMPLAGQLACNGLFAVAIIKMIAQSFSPFLYFQF
ncbi:MAG: MBOAT family protein [Rickettsiales bacterium]